MSAVAVSGGFFMPGSSGPEDFAFAKATSEITKFSFAKRKSPTANAKIPEHFVTFSKLIEQLSELQERHIETVTSKYRAILKLYDENPDALGIKISKEIGLENLAQSIEHMKASAIRFEMVHEFVEKKLYSFLQKTDGLPNEDVLKARAQAVTFSAREKEHIHLLHEVICVFNQYVESPEFDDSDSAFTDIELGSLAKASSIWLHTLCD